MRVKLSPVIQISLSTAEDSAYYFNGPELSPHVPDLTTIIPAGVYRVVDDKLFQIIESPRSPQRADPKR